MSCRDAERLNAERGRTAGSHGWSLAHRSTRRTPKDNVGNNHDIRTVDIAVAVGIASRTLFFSSKHHVGNDHDVRAVHSAVTVGIALLMLRVRVHRFNRLSWPLQLWIVSSFIDGPYFIKVPIQHLVGILSISFRVAERLAVQNVVFHNLRYTIHGNLHTAPAVVAFIRNRRTVLESTQHSDAPACFVAHFHLCSQSNAVGDSGVGTIVVSNQSCTIIDAGDIARGITFVNGSIVIGNESCRIKFRRDIVCAIAVLY